MRLEADFCPLEIEHDVVKALGHVELLKCLGDE